jgi:hypothetical protein
MQILGCEVIEMSFLKGADIAIKQGDILFVWPGFQPTEEFKYIEVSTQEEWVRELIVEAFPIPETKSPSIIDRYFNPGFYFPYL